MENVALDWAVTEGVPEELARTRDLVAARVAEVRRLEKRLADLDRDEELIAGRRPFRDVDFGDFAATGMIGNWGKERERLHGIISRLVVWENIHDEKLLREAHQEMPTSQPNQTGSPPPIVAAATQVQPGEEPAAAALLLVRGLPVVQRGRQRVVDAADDLPVDGDVVDGHSGHGILAEPVAGRVGREVLPRSFQISGSECSVPRSVLMSGVSTDI